MQFAGLFDDPHLWLHTHFSEDAMLTLYCRIVGLKPIGVAADGQVFGVQHYGIPDSPENLIKRGYRIVHSLKGDPKFTEAQLRQDFKRLRSIIT